MAIWSSIGSHDQSLHVVDSFLVASHEDGVGVIDGEGV